MEMSPDGVKMLTRIEGKKNQMYHDQAGLPTIGVGHMLTKSELSSGKVRIDSQPISWRDGLTDAEVNDLLGSDLAKTEQAVNHLVKVPLSRNQFDALVSFVFNIGAEAFETSTLLVLLNSGDYDSIPARMRRWVHSKGLVLPVLIARRETEIERWEAV